MDYFYLVRSQKASLYSAHVIIRLPGVPTETPGGYYICNSAVLDFRERLGAERNLREGRQSGLTYGFSVVTVRQPLPMMLIFPGM